MDEVVKMELFSKKLLKTLLYLQLQSQVLTFLKLLQNWVKLLKNLTPPIEELIDGHEENVQIFQETVEDIVVPKTCPGYYFLETLLELDEFVGELGSSYLRNYEGHEENVETL